MQTETPAYTLGLDIGMGSVGAALGVAVESSWGEPKVKDPTGKPVGSVSVLHPKMQTLL